MKKKTKCWMCKGKGRESVSKDIVGGMCLTCNGTGYAEPIIEKYKKKGFDFTDLAKTIQDFIQPREENHGRVTLSDKIKQYLEIKDIGQVVMDGCDLILRLRMGQYRIANTIINKYIESKKKVKNNMFYNEEFDLPLRYLCERIKIEPLDIDEPLYKGIELGEYVKCYQENRMCKDVKDCWITRKGFAKCKEGGKYYDKAIREKSRTKKRRK